MWYEGVELQIINLSNYHINTKVTDDTIGSEWFLTSFYDIPETSKRENSWSLLGRINQEPEVGWCIIGDFNKITTQDEKIRGRRRP